MGRSKKFKIVHICVSYYSQACEPKYVHSVKSKNVIFAQCMDENCPRHIDFRLEASESNYQVHLIPVSVS